VFVEGGLEKTRRSGELSGKGEQRRLDFPITGIGADRAVLCECVKRKLWVTCTPIKDLEGDRFQKKGEEGACGDKGSFKKAQALAGFQYSVHQPRTSGKRTE